MFTRISVFFENQLLLLRNQQNKNIAYGILVFLLVVVVGVAVFVIGNNEDAIRATEDKSGHVASAELDSYDRVIREGNPVEIKRFIAKLRRTRSSEFAIQFEQLKQEIALSDRLLEITSDEELAEFSLLSRLQSQRDLQKLLVSFDISLANDDQTLPVLAETNLNNPITEIRKLSRSIVTYQDLIRWSQAEADSKERLEAVVLESVKEHILTDPQDPKYANELINDVSSLSPRIQKAQDIYRHIAETYKAHSSEEKILVLIKTLERDLFRLTYGLPNLSKKEQLVVIRTLNDQSAIANGMINNIEKGVATSKDYGQLVHTLLVRIQFDSNPARIRAAVEKVSPYIDDEFFPDKSRLLFDQLFAWSNALGSPLKNTTITDVDEITVNLVGDESELNFFFLPNLNQKWESSIDGAKKFGLGFRKLIENGMMNYMVLVDSELSDEDNWAGIQAEFENIPHTRLARIPANQMKLIKEQVPTPVHPCWLVVDKDGVIIEIMTSPALLGARLPVLLVK